MKSILLLDQDKVYAKNLGQYLSGRGFLVNLVSDAQTAIVKVDESRPDVIICEMLLASNNGLEFIYELRSYKEWQEIPLIVLSRLEQSEANISARSMADFGIADYLYKPEVSMQGIVSKIEKVLDVEFLLGTNNG